MPQPRRGQAAPAPPSVSQAAAGQEVAPGTGGAGALAIPPAAAAAGGAAGAGVAGATYGGAIVTGLAGEAAIAYGTKQIIDGLLSLFRRKIPLDVLYVITALERQYPGLPQDDIERIRQHELERERQFQAKTIARWNAMLPKLLAIPNPAERADAMRKFRERERQIMEARQHAMLERGQAAVERTYLRVLSPQGAFWSLSPHVKAHTLDCLVMGGKFWPWKVLDEIHPPLHHGCPCVLFGLDEALQRGLMTLADIPPNDDLALARARRDIAKALKLQEAVSPEQYGLWAASQDGENLPAPDAAVDLVLNDLVQEAAMPMGWEVLEASYTDHLHPRDRVGRWVRTLGFPSYKVGGTVRDQMIGRPSKDDDFMVMAHPDQIRKAAEAAGARVDDLKVRDRVVGVRVFPTTEDHPLPAEGVEIAPPRIEVSTGEGRHDFTIVPHPAVDPGPKPVAHWHGTTSKELGGIRHGFFTTSSKTEAEDYAGVDDYFDPEDQGTVVPVTVDLKNPKVYEGSWPGANSPEVAALPEQGHDGVIVRFPADLSDPSNPTPAREWTYVFDPATVTVGHEGVAAPSDPIADDAMRRDFTLNALYQDVASGEVLDPTGRGKEDLEAGQLRTTSPDSFREDSLRMLRATRFMATHGFELHPTTRQQMIDNAPALNVMTSGGVSGTAVTELNKTLMGPHVGDALRAMRDTGTLAAFLPELSPAIGFDQESRYHDLPLDEHIFSVVENLADAGAPLEVRLAALFHDAGKPEAAFRGEDDRLHYYGRPESPQFKVNLDFDTSVDPMDLNAVRRIEARDANGILVGVLAFTLGRVEYPDNEYDDTLRIKSLEVNPQVRRRGVATQLMDEAQRLFPYHVIDPGSFTSEGAAFWGERTGEPTTGSTEFVRERDPAEWLQGREPRDLVPVGGSEAKPEHAEAGAAIARAAMERLNYPAETTDRVERLVRHHMVNTEMKRPARVRKWRAEVGADLVDDLLAHRQADISAKGEGADPEHVAMLDRFAEVARANAEAPTVRGDLAITGRDLIAAGVPPGPQMGVILDDLLQHVISDPSLNRKDWLLAQVAKRYPPDVPQTDDIMGSPVVVTPPGHRSAPDIDRVEPYWERYQRIGMIGTLRRPSSSRWWHEHEQETSATLEEAFAQYPALSTGVGEESRPLRAVLRTSGFTNNEVKLKSAMPPQSPMAILSSPQWDMTGLLLNDQYPMTDTIGAVERGFLSPAAMTTRGLVWHEMGHALMYAVGNDDPAASNEARGAAHMEFLAAFGITFDELAELSDYAASDPQEAFAELSSMYHVAPGQLDPELREKATRLFDSLAEL